MLRLEARNEILVAELILRPVGRDMMSEFRAALHIHIARIPFAAESGQGIKPPMNEDSELGVGIPLRRRMLLQRGPVGPERAAMLVLVHQRQQSRPLRR